MEAYRLFEDAGLFYLTFTVIDWLPVFVNEQSCMIIADSLNFCHREKHLRINSFVIMPTHMHLIVFDAEFNTVRLQDTLTTMRKYTGQRLSDLCDKTMPRAIRRDVTSFDTHGSVTPVLAAEPTSRGDHHPGLLAHEARLSARQSETQRTGAGPDGLEILVGGVLAAGYTWLQRCDSDCH